jgi:hypothetical protein
MGLLQFRVKKEISREVLHEHGFFFCKGSWIWCSIICSKPVSVARGLKRGSAAACLLGLRVRIPSGCGRVSIVSVVLSDKGLCVVLINRPEETYRVCVCVIVNPRQWGGPGTLGAVTAWNRKRLLEVFIGNHCVRTRVFVSVIVLRYVLQNITAGLFVSNRLYRSEYFEGVIVNIIIGL